MVKLMFGDGAKGLYIQRSFIQNPDWNHTSSHDPYSKTDVYNQFYEPDISEETGHILVNYMYTGQYQTLEKKKKHSPVTSEPKSEFLLAFEAFSQALTANNETKRRFSLAVEALFAAEKCHLPGLQILVKAEIHRLGNMISVLDLIRLVDDGFGLKLSSKATESKQWFIEFLKTKLRNAFLEDENFSLSESLIFECLRNIELLRSLAISIDQIHSERIKEFRSQIYVQKEEDESQIFPSPIITKKKSYSSIRTSESDLKRLDEFEFSSRSESYTPSSLFYDECSNITTTDNTVQRLEKAI